MNIQKFVSTVACVCFALGIAAAADKKASATKKVIASPSEEAHLQDLPFSPAILKGDTLYVSGQIGFGPNGRPEKFEDEVKIALETVGKTLNRAGYDFSDCVTANVYLTDIGLIERMNAVYKTFFPTPRPVRATVAVAALVGGARFEIMVTARK